MADPFFKQNTWLQEVKNMDKHYQAAAKTRPKRRPHMHFCQKYSCCACFFRTNLGGANSNIFLNVQPLFVEDEPNLTKKNSDGLVQPPTSCDLPVMEGRFLLCKCQLLSAQIL